jgi:hypothetical protein
LRATAWQKALLILATVVTLPGCSEEAKKDMEKMKAEAAKEADKLGDKAGQAGEKIKEGASALNEKAVAFLGPIKEKIGGLDQLKDKPAELKKAVEGLIATIESKAEGLNLPEKAKNTIATVKEKLVALNNYLAGSETKPEEIDEHVKEVKDAAEGLK